MNSDKHIDLEKLIPFLIKAKQKTYEQVMGDWQFCANPYTTKSNHIPSPFLYVKTVDHISEYDFRKEFAGRKAW